jgi:hypothetical protein
VKAILEILEPIPEASKLLHRVLPKLRELVHLEALYFAGQLRPSRMKMLPSFQHIELAGHNQIQSLIFIIIDEVKNFTLLIDYFSV